MTREEAIRIAQGLITDFKCESETMVEFCNVVIKALKKEPCEDAISRTDVLEAISELNSTTFGQVVSRTVRNLPPVNPQLCGDAISRQAVMNCIDGYSRMILRPLDLKEYIDKLPPVTAEPKTGHWLYIDERKAKCSQCGYIQITGGADKTGHCNIHYGVYKYCTNCGAKMVEPQESENP